MKALLYLAVLALLVAAPAVASPPPLYPGVTGPAQDPSTGGPHELVRVGDGGARGAWTFHGTAYYFAQDDPVRLWRFQHWPTMGVLLRWAHRFRYGL